MEVFARRGEEEWEEEYDDMDQIEEEDSEDADDGETSEEDELMSDLGQGDAEVLEEDEEMVDADEEIAASPDHTMVDVEDSNMPPASLVPLKRTLSMNLRSEMGDLWGEPAVQPPTAPDLTSAHPDLVREDLPFAEMTSKKKAKSGKEAIASTKKTPGDSFDKAYVTAHPELEFYHAGRGVYRSGPNPRPRQTGSRNTASAQRSPADIRTPGRLVRPGEAGQTTRPSLVVKLKMPSTVAELWNHVAGVQQQQTAAAADLIAVVDAMIEANADLLLVVGAATTTVRAYLARFPSHRNKVVAHLARLLLTERTTDIDRVIDAARWIHRRMELDSGMKKCVTRIESEGLLPSQVATELGSETDLVRHRYRKTTASINSEFDKARRVRLPRAGNVTISNAPADIQDKLSALDRQIAKWRELEQLTFSEIAREMNSTLPANQHVPSKNPNNRYSGALQRVREMTRERDLQSYSSQARAITAAYSGGRPDTPLSDAQRQEVIDDSSSFTLQVGSRSLSVQDYLEAYPSHRHAVSDFFHGGTAFQLPPGQNGDYTEELLREWEKLEEDEKGDNNGQLKALPPKGAHKGTKGTSAPAHVSQQKSQTSEANTGQPETVASRRQANDARRRALLAAQDRESLNACMLPLEFSIWERRMRDREGERPSFAELAQELKIDVNTCWKLYDIAYLKFEAWSTAECSREYERLERHAASQRQRFEEAGNVQGRDFSTQQYEDLPELILRHMANQRGIVLRTQAVYRDVLLALLEDDANQGRAPARPQALDIWSDPPAHDIYRLQNLAQSNHQKLQAHLRSNNGQVDAGTGNFNNRYAPPENQRVVSLQAQANKSDHSGEKKNNAKRLQDAFLPRFKRAVLADLSRPYRGVKGPRPHMALEWQMLAYLDAREGISPPLPSFGTTVEHSLTTDQLRARASDREDGLRLSLAGAFNRAELLAHLNYAGIDTSNTSITEGELQGIVTAMHPEIFRNMAQAGFNVRSIATVPADDVRITGSRHLAAPDLVRRNLERVVGRSLYPDRASAQGYLCGLRSLLQSLQPTRRYYEPSAPPFFLTVDNVMQALFQDWDANQEYPPGTLGTATDEFGQFLRDRIVDRLELPRDTAEHEERYRQMTTLNMAEQTHLALVLEFLHGQGILDRHYLLGIVTASAGPHQPATAHVLSNADHDLSEETPVVWFHHDNAQATPEARILREAGEGELLGHYSPFVLYGERVQLVDHRSLRRPGAELLPTLKRIRKWSELTEKQKKDREDTYERDKAYKAKKKGRKSCLTCREAEVGCEPQQVDQKVKKTKQEAAKCKHCFELDVQCDWPEVIASPAFKLQAPEGLTGEQLAAWDVENPDWEELERLARLVTPTPLEPSTKKWALHLHYMRTSGQVDANYLNTLIARLPGFRVRMQTLLYSGAQTPEAQLLGGQQLPIQFVGFVTQRRGLLPMPIYSTNGLADPYMLASVNLWQNLVLDAQNGAPLPERIIITTSGLAGLRVGILAFGDHTRGWWRWLSNASPVLADKIYLVSIVQPHVFAGHAHSMPQAHQQYFSQEQGKHLISNKLKDLIVRNANHMHYAALNQQPPATPNSGREDAHILLLDDSHAWRAHQLAPTTVPTNQHVQMRNMARNGAW